MLKPRKARPLVFMSPQELVQLTVKLVPFPNLGCGSDAGYREDCEDCCASESGGPSVQVGRSVSSIGLAVSTAGSSVGTTRDWSVKRRGGRGVLALRGVSLTVTVTKVVTTMSGGSDGGVVGGVVAGAD